MKIVHICPQFSDGWSYQENVLPKYHHKMGNEVTIIASDFAFDNSGNIVKCEHSDYLTPYGVKILRLPTKGGHGYFYKFRDLEGLYKVLENEQPDIIFQHGVQFVYVNTVYKYVKDHQVKLYVDNHGDHSNSATNWLSEHVLHRIIWRHMAKKIEPYVTRFYGVLPARVSWMTEMYGIPADRCELLLMGADDEDIEEIEKDDFRQSVRSSVRCTPEDFLIVTGGKIDKAKTQTMTLMRVVNQLISEGLRVKLIVFGSVESDLRQEFDGLLNDDIRYAGWLSTQDAYRHLAAADLVVFPGRHSVYWEQVAALGVPMVCKYWDGTTDIDLGGNMEFLYEDSQDALADQLRGILTDKERFSRLQSVAKSEKRKDFLYSTIAEKSLK